LHVEIAISDFPKRSEPSIRRTRVRGSSGIGVRYFRISEDRGTVTPGIAISRNAISRQSESWAPEGVIGDKCRRASGFGVLEVLCILTTGIAKFRHAISRQRKGVVEDRCRKVEPRSGQRQVASELGNRGSVRCVIHDLVKADFPTGKIPTRVRKALGNTHRVSGNPYFLLIIDFLSPFKMGA
jgi:hypothetical protein